ncbi:hypothetical protein EI94DRAFT_1703706 [Lactarius quietus]|nr:hypothetical protein EI94DRAFT_1703706 [Lactarius quietus]
MSDCRGCRDRYCPSYEINDPYCESLNNVDNDNDYEDMGDQVGEGVGNRPLFPGGHGGDGAGVCWLITDHLSVTAQGLPQGHCISKMSTQLFSPSAPAGRGKRAGSREGFAPSKRHGLNLPKCFCVF